MLIGFGELMLAILIPAMLLASWNDYRSHRVPNWLNAAIVLTGLTAHAAWGGIGDGLLGVLVGGGPLVLLWAMRGIGAGDVKFMAALGAWLGPQAACQALIIGALIGGVFAVGQIVMRGVWHQAAVNVGVLLTKVSSARTAFGDFGSARSLAESTGMMPYAIPLSLGTGVVMMSNYCGWWGVL